MIPVDQMRQAGSTPQSLNTSSAKDHITYKYKNSRYSTLIIMYKINFVA